MAGSEQKQRQEERRKVDGKARVRQQADSN
jgi:hypothetical protein